MKSLNPNISVDCVIFGYDFSDLNVLLVERKLISDNNELVFTDYSLLGNHIYEGEDIDAAAYRILGELTGIREVSLEQFHTFADPLRLAGSRDRTWLKSIGFNPDNRVITVGYYTLMNCKEARLQTGRRKVEWVPVDKAAGLAFDHDQILEKALQDLRRKAMLDPIIYRFLPKKFTLSQLQQLYEVIFRINLDKRNFRKKVARMPYLIPLNEKQVGVAHKPARLYMFSREVFDMTRKEVFDFTL